MEKNLFTAINVHCWPLAGTPLYLREVVLENLLHTYVCTEKNHNHHNNHHEVITARCQPSATITPTSISHQLVNFGESASKSSVEG